MRVVMLRGTLAHHDARLTKEWRSLKRHGHGVHVLDWNFTGASTEGGAIPAHAITHFNLRARRGSYALLLALPLWWCWLFWQLLRKDWDAVHSCDLDTLPPAVLAARLLRRRVVHDVFDYYPDMLSGKVPAFAVALMRWLYALLLPRVDAVIIADAARAGQIAPRAPDAVVMNCPEDASEDARERPRRAPRPPGELRVFYAGTLTRSRGVLTLLDAVAAESWAQVDLAGYGSEAGEVRERCERALNARYHGPLPYAEVVRRSREADVLFAFYDPQSPNNRLASPNKLFEAMMLARPFVTNEGTLAAERAREIGMGLVVPFGRAEALRDALRRLAEDPALCEKLGAAGRRAFEAEYNWQVMERRLVALYARLDPHGEVVDLGAAPTAPAQAADVRRP